ncbi:thr operon leader peptide [Colwellia sp. D2M02]|nr:thr operon leader peptide [Colwellia sp. D2M02]
MLDSSTLLRHFNCMKFKKSHIIIITTTTLIRMAVAG